MAKNRAAHPRQIWKANLAPLTVAARQGASHATATARRELSRARRQRRRRLGATAITLTGLAAVAAAGGAAAVLASRRSNDRLMAELAEAAESTTNDLRSRMDIGLEKVSDLGRSVRHRFNGDRPAEPDEPGEREDAVTVPETDRGAGG